MFLFAFRCTIFPSVRALLLSLTLPNEGPANPNQQMGGQMPPQPQQPPQMRPMMTPQMMQQQRMQMMGGGGPPQNHPHPGPGGYMGQ